MMARMLKPRAPKKPVAPKPPSKMLPIRAGRVAHDVNDWSVEQLVGFCEQNNLAMSECYIEIDHEEGGRWDRCDYNCTLTSNSARDIHNPRYDEQLKEYEAKKLKHKKKLEAHKENMKAYKLRVEKWEAQQLVEKRELLMQLKKELGEV